MKAGYFNFTVRKHGIMFLKLRDHNYLMHEKFSKHTYTYL